MGNLGAVAAQPATRSRVRIRGSVGPRDSRKYETRRIESAQTASCVLSMCLMPLDAKIPGSAALLGQAPLHEAGRSPHLPQGRSHRVAWHGPRTGSPARDGAITTPSAGEVAPGGFARSPGRLPCTRWGDHHTFRRGGHTTCRGRGSASAGLEVREQSKVRDSPCRVRPDGELRTFDVPDAPGRENSRVCSPARAGSPARGGVVTTPSAGEVARSAATRPLDTIAR